jgi:FMN phosphatase YigB (HAD superfamily)
MPNTDPSLVCLDFDNTLINGHSHNFLIKKYKEDLVNNFKLLMFDPKDNLIIVDGNPQGNEFSRNPTYDKEAVTKVMDSFLDDHRTGLKDKDSIKNTFSELLASGNRIAITSFNNFPDVINLALDKLALPPEQRKAIIVVAGFPPAGQNDPERKNYHIKAAMEKAGISDPNKVMLVDDSKPNITKAAEAGYQTVQVLKQIDRAEYLTQVVEKARKMNHPTMEQQQSTRPEPLYQNLQGQQQQVTPPPLPPRRSPSPTSRSPNPTSRSPSPAPRSPSPASSPPTSLLRSSPTGSPPSRRARPLGLVTDPREEIPLQQEKNLRPAIAPRPAATLTNFLQKATSQESSRNGEQTKAIFRAIRTLYSEEDVAAKEQLFKQLLQNPILLNNGEVKIPLEKDDKVRDNKDMLKAVLAESFITENINDPKGKAYLTFTATTEVKEYFKENNIPLKQPNLTAELRKNIDALGIREQVAGLTAESGGRLSPPPSPNKNPQKNLGR